VIAFNKALKFCKFVSIKLTKMKVSGFGIINFLIIISFLAYFIIFSSCFFANYPNLVDAEYIYTNHLKYTDTSTYDTIEIVFKLKDSSAISQYKGIGRCKLTGINLHVNYFGVGNPVMTGKMYFSETPDNSLQLFSDDIFCIIYFNTTYSYCPVIYNNEIADKVNDILTKNEVIYFYLIVKAGVTPLMGDLKTTFNVNAIVYPNV